ncbi:hypothetical protein, partial [Klebsiella pneumoniae]|uniref:hypothetical protein n=1 Tax=Klebsiella pneumoniae TaxID=573 RepID=UPI002731F69B
DLLWADAGKIWRLKRQRETAGIIFSAWTFFFCSNRFSLCFRKNCTDKITYCAVSVKKKRHACNFLSILLSSLCE